MAKMHHYVPQFLQRAWADQRGLIRCWHWQEERISSFVSGPRNLMGESRLYRADDLTENPDQFEHGLAELEGLAAAVAAKFRHSSPQTLDTADFEAWAAFLLTQRGRVPERVRWTRAHAVAGFADVIREHDDNYRQLTASSPSYTPEEHITKYFPDLQWSFPLRTMMEITFDPVNVKALMRMQWNVRSGFPDPIILGDDPMIMEGGLLTGACLIALPISPDKVFFAASTEGIMRSIISVSGRELGRRVNHAQAVNAKRQVIGNVSPRFLEKRLSKPQTEV